MADIFISYASEDRARVEPLVTALTVHGWTVFWDQTVPPGLTWRDYIGKALDDSRSVVVVWSRTSVGKEFVLEEAGGGKERRVLCPVRIDDVVPPFGFRETQAANLVGWTDDTAHPELLRLVQALERMLGTPAPVDAPPSAKPDPGRPTPAEPSEPASADLGAATALGSNEDRPQPPVPNIQEAEPSNVPRRRSAVVSVVSILVLLVGSAAGYWLWSRNQDQEMTRLLEEANKATASAQFEQAASLLQRAEGVKPGAEAVALARKLLADARARAVTSPKSISSEHFNWESYDFDVFWCEDSPDGARQFAEQIVARLRAEDAKGRLRARVLTTETNQKPGYKVQGYEIRRNNDEIEQAAALKKLGDRIIGSRGSFEIRGSAQETRFYLSAFVCPAG